MAVIMALYSCFDFVVPMCPFWDSKNSIDGTLVMTWGTSLQRIIQCFTVRIPLRPVWKKGVWYCIYGLRPPIGGHLGKCNK